MPIVMAQQGRRFKDAVTHKVAYVGSYCTAQKIYYYGIKLHILTSFTKGMSSNYRIYWSCSYRNE